MTGRGDTMIAIRPIRPSDFELERAFVRGLSRFSAYRRLMSSRRPSDEELRHWTEVDGVHEFALVAVASAGDGEEQAGVARYVVSADPEVAEFAVVLSDRWQGQGLGRQLLGRLVNAARGRGIKRLVGATLSDNTAMLQLGRKLGFKPKRVLGDATVTELTLHLDDADATAQRAAASVVA